MIRTPHPTTSARNRLRAAAALIPIIESGLIAGKLSEGRARQMLKFCEWAMNSEATDQDAIDLNATIRNGLFRLEARLNAEELSRNKKMARPPL